MAYSVYRHTCPNGKVYIGITKLDLSNRWRAGIAYMSNPYFNEAISLYGWDNIKHEILFQGLPRSEAEALEVGLIAMYNATDRRFGYNISPGAHMIADETRDKLRVANTGKRHTEETKRVLSGLRKGTKADLSTREKMSTVRTGMLKPRSTRENMSAARGFGAVVCIETGVRYASRNEASRHTGIGKTQISACLSGMRDTAGGFHWRCVDRGNN
jgi:hypothetical protein